MEKNMNIKFLKITCLSILLGNALHAMDVPRHTTKQTILAQLKDNEHNAKTAASARGFSGPVRFKLLAIHPFPNLTRIDNFVKQNETYIKQFGYKISKMEKRHLTLMTFHVPFKNWKVDCNYVEQATKDLAAIVKKHLEGPKGLYDTNFTYTNFDTLVRGKHLVALHQVNQQDKQKFDKAYLAIVRDFLEKYPGSWLSRYDVKPHVTVATRKGEARKLAEIDLNKLNGTAFQNTLTLGYRKTIHASRPQIRISSQTTRISGPQGKKDRQCPQYSRYV